MSIVTFLKEAKNTKVREELINHYLFYELKKVAASRGYHLKIYQAVVDIEGFDIIMDDDDTIRKFQLKTALVSTKKEWGIHKVMLSPRSDLFEEVRFLTPVGCPSILDGGVILIRIADDFNFQYFYTDVYILRAFELKLFALKTSKTTTDTIANHLLDEVRTGGGLHDKVSVPHSMFLQIQSPEALLAIAGFHTHLHCRYSSQLIQLFKIESEPYSSMADKIAALTPHWESLQENLPELLEENFAKKIIYPAVNDVFK